MQFFLFFFFFFIFPNYAVVQTGIRDVCDDWNLLPLLKLLLTHTGMYSNLIRCFNSYG